MGGKVHQTEEEKYLQSLKSWGDDDNRPFIRIKVDEEKDRIAYERKWRKITDERIRIALITGDPLQNINLIDSFGHEYSRGGNVRDYKD